MDPTAPELIVKLLASQRNFGDIQRALLVKVGHAVTLFNLNMQPTIFRGSDVENCCIRPNSNSIGTDNTAVVVVRM